ncbi:MAG: pirin family protein [Spirochaetota bacterium]
MHRDIVTAALTREGAGVRLHRVFGFHQIPRFDPFLMLDDFSSDTPADYLAGFPWHPHRGIETVTYLLAGSVRHGDSMGTRGVIGAGDVQWMTAGSGIIHEEMPEMVGDGQLKGFQLWVNLPRRHKMTAPRYRGIAAADIPVVASSAGSVRVIAGSYGSVIGPVKELMIDIVYLDVTCAPKSDFSHALPKGHAAFAYVFEGSVDFGGQLLSRREAMALTSVSAHSETGGRFLLASGVPLKEPIAWGGPIVMNTEEELRTAFDDYENGTFIARNEPSRP